MCYTDEKRSDKKTERNKRKNALLNALLRPGEQALCHNVPDLSAIGWYSCHAASQ